MFSSSLTTCLLNGGIDMEEELIKIETKLAFLEDAVMELTKADEWHRRRIELLTHENRVMKEKIRELMDMVEEEIPSRKPPHY